MVKFPKEVFVTVDLNDDTDDKDKGLLAWRDIKSGIEDFGPTAIGIYRLVRVEKAVLAVQVSHV